MSSLKRKYELPSESSESIPSRSERLNRKLSSRPDRHQLIEQGILHESQCAPSLQHAEHALKRARLVDQLNQQLTNRPGPLELIQEKILHLDDKEHSHVEQAIQGGQISFKSTSARRSLVFHEYTGSPALCKPKVTKIDCPSSSSTPHQIRLAQQDLLLELTRSSDVDESRAKSLVKSLDQMTLVELREQCKQYQLPSSHANKSQLIQRIEQHRRDKEDPLELFNPSEFDEILPDVYPLDSDLFNWTKNEANGDDNDDDDAFLQMLLETETSSRSELIFDDYLPVSSPVPRITSVDEFDAFLRDFTSQLSSYQHEIPS